jgi:hypothetical protein
LKFSLLRRSKPGKEPGKVAQAVQLVNFSFSFAFAFAFAGYVATIREAKMTHPVFFNF